MSAVLAQGAYSGYGDVLHRYLVWCLSSAEGARELSQEVYLRLVSVPDDRLIRHPQAYVFKVANHLIYELRKREKHRVVTFDSRTVDCMADRVTDPVNPEPGERLQMQQQIEAVLSRLPPLYQAILLHKKRDGMSYEEIACRLGISVHTVKKYLTRAVAQSRALLFP